MPRRTRSAVKGLLVRLPEELHRQLLLMARTQNLSVNKLCVRCIEAGIRSNEGTHYDRLNQQLKAEWGADFLGLILFGSAARDELRPDSDIDLLIVLSDQLPLTRSLYSRWEEQIAPHVARTFAREVSPHFAHLPHSAEAAGSIWLECALEGKLLHDPSGEVSAKTKAVRELIARGAVTRATSHGHPYWIRTENEKESDPWKTKVS